MVAPLGATTIFSQCNALHRRHDDISAFQNWLAFATRTRITRHLFHTTRIAWHNTRRRCQDLTIVTWFLAKIINGIQIFATCIAIHDFLARIQPANITRIIATMFTDIVNAIWAILGIFHIALVIIIVRTTTDQGRQRNRRNQYFFHLSYPYTLNSVFSDRLPDSYFNCCTKPPVVKFNTLRVRTMSNQILFSKANS